MKAYLGILVVSTWLLSLPCCWAYSFKEYRQYAMDYPVPMVNRGPASFVREGRETPYNSDVSLLTREEQFADAPQYEGGLLEEQAATASATGPSGTSDVNSASTNAAAAASTASASVLSTSQTSSQSSSDSSSDSSSSSQGDALDQQLQAALDAVVADMISKGKQVLAEKQWTVDVQSVITEYQQKIQNVYANIESLKSDMKALYIKKKQIENAQLQKSLTSKLQDARSDLATVTTALSQVENTRDGFMQNEEDIQNTINQITQQLAQLQGTTSSSSKSSASSSSNSDSSDSSSSDSSRSSDSTSSDSSSDASNSDSSSSDSSSNVSDQDIVDKKTQISNTLASIQSVVNGLDAL